MQTRVEIDELRTLLDSGAQLVEVLPEDEQPATATWPAS